MKIVAHMLDRDAVPIAAFLDETEPQSHGTGLQGKPGFYRGYTFYVCRSEIQQFEVIKGWKVSVKLAKRSITLLLALCNRKESKPHANPPYIQQTVEEVTDIIRNEVTEIPVQVELLAPSLPVGTGPIECDVNSE